MIARYTCGMLPQESLLSSIAATPPWLQRLPGRLMDITLLQQALIRQCRYGIEKPVKKSPATLVMLAWFMLWHGRLMANSSPLQVVVAQIIPYTYGMLPPAGIN